MDDPATMEELPPPPQASVSGMIEMFASQAMASMGKIPGSEAGEVRLDYAKYFIDLLDVLQQKTTGQLSADEASALEQTLHYLRMIFLQESKK